MQLHIYRKKNYFEDELPVSGHFYIQKALPPDQTLFSVNPSRREFWKITLAEPEEKLNQKSFLSCNGKKVEIREGIIFLSRPDDLTEMELPDGSFVMNILILRDFMGMIAEELNDFSGFFRIFEENLPEGFRYLHYTKATPRLKKLLKNILFETQHTDSNTLSMLKYLLGTFLIEFRRIFMQHSRKHAEDLISGTEEFLRENFRRKITLELLAEHFGVSGPYLAARFRKERNCTLKEYLSGIRLEHAAELLGTTNETVSGIWKSCGFPNPNCFFSAFRKKYSCTPLEYRNHPACSARKRVGVTEVYCTKKREK